MTTASHRQGLSPSILVYKPDPTGYTPADTFLTSLTDQIDTYQHVIQANGGYWSANFTIKDNQAGVEDWISNGLGRHVEVYDNHLVKIWEGFVNKVLANLGPLSVTRGPLLNVANRASVIYSTIDTSENPPVVGVRARTAEADDTDSQTAFGILQTVLSAGGATQVEAEQARDTFLEVKREPETGQTVTIGRAGEPMAKIECMGYIHWFKKYVYNQTANTGTQNLSTQIEDVITADPNSLFDTGFAQITANTLAVQRYENKDRKALDVITALVKLGDASNNRYIFGVYNDQVSFYEQAPTTLEYQQRLGDPEQRVETSVNNKRVLPWNVLPGKWLLFTDFLVGETVLADLNLDPRAMFIESVNFRAPWSLTIRGGKTDKLSQELAKFGLGGN